MNDMDRPAVIQEMCRAFIDNDEGFFFGIYVWPEGPHDEGLRDDPIARTFVKLMPESDQDLIRRMMGFALDEALKALKYEETKGGVTCSREAEGRA